MKKILLVATVEMHIMAFHIPCIRMLQNEGYEVHVATRLGPLREELEGYGVRCHHIEFARSPFTWQTIVAARQLIKLMRSIAFALVHVHTPVGAFLGRLAAYWTGTAPVIYTAHGFHFFSGASRAAWLVYGNLERVAAKWTDGLIVINQEDYQTAQTELGFVPGKNLFHVHGVGVSSKSTLPEDRKKIRQELEISDAATVVICVAELVKNKNHEFLLRAWQQVTVKHGDVQLLFVGEGVELANLQKLVSAEMIQRVKFLGFRNDVSRLLAVSDIAALVSWREGLPRAVMEAMLAGIPVVGSDIRGNRDLIESGGTGFLVSLGDIDALADALDRLIGNAEMRRRFGDSGRKRIALFSDEQVLMELEPSYRRYLNDRGRWCDKAGL